MLITQPVRVGVTAVTLVALLASPLAPLIAAQAPATTKPATAAPATAKPAAAAPATAKPAAAATAAAVPSDGDWPRSFTTGSGASLVIYQPQILSWEGQKHVVAYAAEVMGVEAPPEIAFETAQLSPMARSFYGENKRVSNAAIKQAGYRFIFPDYRAALDSMWAERSWRGDGETDAASPINPS